jgi:hypothetical protein
MDEESQPAGKYTFLLNKTLSEPSAECTARINGRESAQCSVASRREALVKNSVDTQLIYSSDFSRSSLSSLQTRSSLSFAGSIARAIGRFLRLIRKYASQGIAILSGFRVFSLEKWVIVNEIHSLNRSRIAHPKVPFCYLKRKSNNQRVIEDERWRVDSRMKSLRYW